VSCAKEKKIIKNVNESSNQKFDLNISLLLDLSDRIDPMKYPNESMEFYKRDIGYIKSVSDAFNTHIRSKRIRKVNDKIQLFFDPEPKNSEINSISNKLKFYLNNDNITQELLSVMNETYATEPEKIYDLAIQDKSYIGSNTWRFFKNKVKDYCIDDGYRNILVLLTDGYIYHKDSKIKEGNQTTYITPQDIRNNKLSNNDWRNKIENEHFGFIPATEGLLDIEILVLGINPDNKNPYEEDILMHYWKNWFNTMNVRRYEIKTAELPSNLDKIIKDFILNN
jgi:hypothetical protein